jgi:hypothetical protein
MEKKAASPFPGLPLSRQPGYLADLLVKNAGKAI